MREIKFRGITEGGKWIYGGYVIRNGAHYILDGECDHLEIDGCEKNILHFRIVKYKTVGQYTGLKDKNGKEIYEGDIVRVSPQNPILYDIVWHEDLAKYCLHETYQGRESWLSPYARVKTYEVIGNIYENL